MVVDGEVLPTDLTYVEVQPGLCRIVTMAEKKSSYV